MTLDELDAAREWMLLLGRKTARERIASLFVIMARRDAAWCSSAPGATGLRFPLYISREAMADYLGLTIETVSRQISPLRREGLIVLVAVAKWRCPTSRASGRNPAMSPTAACRPNALFGASPSISSSRGPNRGDVSQSMRSDD